VLYTIHATSSLYAMPGRVEVKTYRDVLAEYRRHAETKSLASTGKVCDGTTVGLLQRRTITVRYVTHVGKESNRLEEVNAGLVHDPDEVYTEYIDPRHDPTWQRALQHLKRIPIETLMAETELSRSQLIAIRNGHARPRAANRQRLLQVAQRGNSLTPRER
jgi:hypothetical protein